MFMSDPLQDLSQLSGTNNNSERATAPSLDVVLLPTAAAVRGPRHRL